MRNAHSLGLNIRSMFVMATYHKALKLHLCAKQGTESGKLVNLMAADAEGFLRVMYSTINFCLAPFILIAAVVQIAVAKAVKRDDVAPPHREECRHRIG